VKLKKEKWRKVAQCVLGASENCGFVAFNVNLDVRRRPKLVRHLIHGYGLTLRQFRLRPVSGNLEVPI